MPLPLEFAILGPPVSQQARRRDRVRAWIQQVRQRAAAYWGSELPSTEPVMVSITYFFDGVDFDVDNIPKPILDALKGLVYVDDRQVTDLICRKRRHSDDLAMDMDSLPIGDLLIAHGQFLVIQVSDRPVVEVLL
jgi:Holliday junction resolvase RusA-like endonuclease